MATMFLGCEADMDVGVGEETERGLQARVVSYSDNPPVPKTLVAKMKRTGNRRRSPWIIKVTRFIDYLRHKQ